MKTRASLKYFTTDTSNQRYFNVYEILQQVILLSNRFSTHPTLLDIGLYVGSILLGLGHEL